MTYGEAAPLPDFSVESFTQAESVLRDYLTILVNTPKHPFQPDHFLSSASPSASFAIESALWGFSVKRWLSAPKTAPLLLGSTSSIIQRLLGWQGEWPVEFKMKVGKDTLVDDAQRVTTVIKLLPDGVVVRLDANQRWTLQQALEFHQQLLFLSDYSGADLIKKIAYIEEPTATLSEFPAFYQKTGIGYALDESLQHGHTVTLSKLEGLRALVIKPTLTGGLYACRQLADVAISRGIRVVLSSSFESLIGIHCLTQLSARWFPDEAPGLDTLSAFANNIVDSMPEPGCSLPSESLKQMELVWQASRS